MKKPLEQILPKGQIRIKAMCLFFNKGKILAAKGFDSKKNQAFFRIMGGTMEFGETGEQTIRREIKEELNSEIEDLKQVALIENIFTYEGLQGHQITFLYTGTLTRKEIYDQPAVKVHEADYEFEADWVPWEDVLSGKIILYPTYDFSKIEMPQ